MNADELLSRLVARRVAQEVPPGPGASRTVRFGHLEVATASKAGETFMRARWRERVGSSELGYLLVFDDSKTDGSVLVLGPRAATEPLRSMDCEGLASAIERAAAMPSLEASRHIATEVVRLAGRGLLVSGLLTRHMLEHRILDDPTFGLFAAEALQDVHWDGDWRSLPAGLGYDIETLEPRGYLLRFDSSPVAVVHPKADPSDFMRLDDAGRPPEGVLAADCRSRGARYGLLACRNRYRLFDCDPAASTAEWLDLDAQLLGDERRACLALLAPRYLAEGGFTELQDEAQTFGSALRRRLDRTIRHDALPALAAGLERWVAQTGADIDDDEFRQELQRAALTLLFRLLFVLYAESSRYLPTDDATYRRHSLAELVAEAQQTQDDVSDASTGLWSSFGTLVRALRTGNPAWGVPAYNGALFSNRDFEGAALLEEIELDDRCFAEVLTAVGIDAETGRGVDYSSLEIAHIGHIYETLLSLQLTVADRPLRYDLGRDRYIAAADEPEIVSGSLLWQAHEGGRKAGGVYYTPVPLVKHLVRQAVLPAFEGHLDEVRHIAKEDPVAAANQLLDFAVLDPACGSAHFLVEVTDLLAESTVTFLAETPLPKIRESINGLRSQARAGIDVTDAALLRRLLLKHCVYGTDVSPMGAEIATLSLWLASFVPGLSLAYLGRNVVVGNALIGVASASSVVPEGTFQEQSLRTALADASEAAERVAEIDDRTPSEVEASKAADAETAVATAGMRRLFDLWTAEGFEVVGAREAAEVSGSDIIADTVSEDIRKKLEAAIRFAAQHHFLHWPLEFPRVFADGRRGFDAVVGNPPWEEVTIEELAFYGLHLPGLRGLPSHQRQAEIVELRAERPELAGLLEQEQERVTVERAALASGEYVSTGGDPDLYKYFCQRYRSLVREGGMIGVVLPRSTFVTQGSEGFRDWLYTEMTARRIDTLINRRLWAFETHPQFGVALVTAQRQEPPDGHIVAMLGIADSSEAWESQAASTGVPVAVASLGDGWLTPRLRSQAEADLLAKLRTGSRFPLGSGGRWMCFGVAELHETNDKSLWQSGRGGRQLWKGESFDQYEPHGAAARKCSASAAVLQKIRKPRPGSGSLIADHVKLAVRRRTVSSELERARVAFRDVSRSDDSRTARACLVPPEVLLTNKAPYIAFVDGDEMTQAACLGIINSLPFDWQVRRYVEINMNFFLLESLVVPNLDDADYPAVVSAAARLSAVDDRFAQFAEAVGVEYGPLAADEREHLRIDIDARVARAWQLTHDDLETTFVDFTTDAVTPAYREALVARLRELS
ncbi:Eco57I restriction-modification methylase domain-containing protein [Candidatus Poriferisodalis sp.]|uniref:Eco57I restriction-modification methylase domain-containing protein n=1 Tax=Candidatus Poriferisodalis sp. TaxID=3101277 RepID=UPI003B5CD5E6